MTEENPPRVSTAYSTASLIIMFLYSQYLAYLHLHAHPSLQRSMGKMSEFLVAALVVCLVSHGTNAATALAAWDDQDFFRNFPPSRCSKDGPEIRFPLRLDSSNTSSSSFSTTCVKLACSGKDTIMIHPFLGPCNVTATNYTSTALNITPLTSACTMIQK